MPSVEKRIIRVRNPFMNDLSQIQSRLEEHGERITRAEERVAATDRRVDHLQDTVSEKMGEMVSEIKALRNDWRTLNNTSQQRAGRDRFAKWAIALVISVAGLAFTAYKTFGG